MVDAHPEPSILAVTGSGPDSRPGDRYGERASEPTGPPPAAAHRRRREDTWWWRVLPVATTLAVFTLIELMIRLGAVNREVLPPPTVLLNRLRREVLAPDLWLATKGTLTVAFGGMAIGASLGVVLGLLVGSSRLLWRAVRVPVEFLRPVPSIAYVPLVVLIWGPATESKLFVVVVGMFWLHFIQTLYGVQDVDPVAVDAARAYGLGRIERLWTIVLPSAVPYIATAVRIGALLALVLAIVAELAIGGGPGIGVAIAGAAAQGLKELTFTYAAWSGVVGLAVSAVFDRLERRALHWHPYHRATASHTRPRPFQAVRRLLSAGGIWGAAGQLTWSTRRVASRVVTPLGRLADRVQRRRGESRSLASNRVVGTSIEVVVPLVLVAIWWVWSAGADSLYFPPLSEILVSFRENFLSSELIPTVGPTLRRTFIGFAVGEAVAVTLGLLIGLSPVARRAVNPVLQFFRSIPGPTLLPLFIVILGINEVQKIVTVAVVGLWITILNAIDGVRGIDPMVNETAKAYQISGWLKFRRVTLPAAMPRIFAGMRVHIVIALIIVLISELTGSASGLGYFILLAQSGYDLPDMWAGIIMIGIIGYLMNLGFVAIERHFLSWHRGANRSALAE